MDYAMLLWCLDCAEPRHTSYMYMYTYMHTYMYTYMYMCIPHTRITHTLQLCQ